MGTELLKMADHLAVVVESLRVLAGAGKSTAVNQEKQEKAAKQADTAASENNTASKNQSGIVKVEAIRAVLAEKSQDGKSKEIKALLSKYGAVKLSAVQPEDYESLYREAKVL